MLATLDPFLVIQAIGLIGSAGGMAWPLFRTRAGMLVAQLVANLAFTVHFLLLEAATAAVMNGLSALQVGAALPLGQRPAFRWLYLAVLPLIAVALAVTWNGLPSLFAAAGAALISIGRYQTNVLRFRVLMTVALPLWLGHNALVGSVPGMLSDVTGLVLNLAYLARAGWPRRWVA